MSNPTDFFGETLRPHPATAWAALNLRLQVDARWQTEGVLLLRYQLTGSDLSALCLPSSVPPGPADGLWQHTCFEVFVAADDGVAQPYHEYNFSPSGQWARYRFSGERVRDIAAENRVADGRVPITCTVFASGLQLQAELPLAELPLSTTGWRLGLAAVLEHTDGRLSYWALHHPRPQPDFHHPAGRVLRLQPPAFT